MNIARRFRVVGIVQGVGFRPFVWRLAHELGLRGWVRNDARGVEIVAEGPLAVLDGFQARLSSDAPFLAEIESIAVVAEPVTGQAEFRIESSPVNTEPAATAIGPDTAVCRLCLDELFDPADRRWRYPFINCTDCGPRYTITRHLPYDRAQTSMAGFSLCPACLAEYQDPANRRFHAQPNACPVCGPHLRLIDAAGQPLAGDPIAGALARLRAGEILAIKGLGGYHLAVDAGNAEAVARLRARKQREEKPFAVMFAGIPSAAAHTEILPEEARLLEAASRPIVLLRKRPHADAQFIGVAPGIAWLGCLLPYAPLHWLLFHEAAGRPAGLAWLDQTHPLALVMTSANPGGEPIVSDDTEAVVRLAGIADAYLMHNRPIVNRCDDSVLRLAEERPPVTAFIRRSRGATPVAISLPLAGPPVLAVGAYLKNTVCLTRGSQAFLSQHIGDLDNAATCRMFEETVARLLDLLDVEPVAVAHDAHPDFFSSRFAADFAVDRNIPRITVYHHHAHIVAIAAEHGVTGPLLGLALDGVGLGEGSGLWGGELLRVDADTWQRLGHLRELPLPGGDRAAREPWRMAAAALHAMGHNASIGERFPGPAGRAVAHMLASGIRCPTTSSAGRWFDAAAGLLGLKPIAAYEGQAAMLLEGLAEGAWPGPVVSGGYIIRDGVLDLLPLLTWLMAQTEPAVAAAGFHATLAAGLAQWVQDAAERTGITTVALGGGCFLNRILRLAVGEHLRRAGLSVLAAARAPVNDGGLSLGQAWAAIQQLEKRSCV